jgi:ribose transport system substrate-binding protein
MKKHLLNILAVLVVLSMVLVACGPTPAPTTPPEVKPTDTPKAEAKPVKVVVIGKSVHPYWSNVEKGVIAAGKDLGVETVFFVPPKEDVAAQIQTMETYIAQGVTGIAIAPSDPNALEATMKKAADAGIFVTTLDTPPIEGSVSLVYIGTNNFSAGKTGGETMAKLLPDGGKVGIGRGSDTALNALQRTDGFLEGIKANAKITALEPVNDKEDAATALQLANSVISANPDLAGAFGVYAYNGPAWATAIKEANLVGKVKLVCFDATTDIINGIKECVIDATVAQREYDMGYKSVQIINLMAQKGKDAALTEMGAVDGVIDTGVDVITAATLKDYEAALDKKGIPHDWNTQGWDASACGGAAKPPAGPVKVVVIGKSVHPYWSNVEKGVIAAGKDLGVETVFFVPPKEDVAAQIQTMETYIAQGVTGIAIAPSDPNALEATMKKAADAGIFVTTLDTPPIEGSVSLVYIGTNNFSAGKMAGDTMAKLLPDGGKVGIGRGSDTALNALQRTDGFLEGIKANTKITALEPVNDKEDAATALQLAGSVISANPDLAGAFGVYAYNGPAWATAIKEANLVGKVKLVCFDATTDIINGIKECVIDATVAQREYDMGYKSVQIIKLMADKGVDAALSEMGTVEGVIDTGVDVITAATLKDYEATLDKKGIPHEWNTQGWDASKCGGGAAGALPAKLTIAWIPKALNNPVFETGRDGAFKKAEELTAAGPIPVEVDYVGSVASDAAEQARVVEDVIAKGVNAIGISCNDPTACEDPINKAVAAGVPVMTWDSDSPKSQRFTYLGVDNYQGGKAAAELLVKFMGEKGKVALLTGVPGAFNLEERIRGFKDGVAAYPGIEIAATVYCNDDINLGVQVVEETMQANPDLSGWFFVGLWPLFAERGSMPLWEAAEKSGKLTTISFDTLPVELDFMKDGYVQGLVGQKYFGWGYDTVQMIYDYIVKGTRYESWTDSGMDLVTKCNVKEMADMWAASDFTKTLPDPYACLP